MFAKGKASSCDRARTSHHRFVRTLINRCNSARVMTTTRGRVNHHRICTMSIIQCSFHYVQESRYRARPCYRTTRRSLTFDQFQEGSRRCFILFFRRSYLHGSLGVYVFASWWVSVFCPFLRFKVGQFPRNLGPIIHHACSVSSSDSGYPTCLSWNYSTVEIFAVSQGDSESFSQRQSRVQGQRPSNESARVECATS